MFGVKDKIKKLIQVGNLCQNV